MVTMGIAGIIDLDPAIKKNIPLWQYISLSAQKKSLRKAIWMRRKDRPEIFHHKDIINLLNGTHPDWLYWNFINIEEDYDNIKLSFASATPCALDLPVSFLRLLIPYIKHEHHPLLLTGYEGNSRAYVYQVDGQCISREFLPLIPRSSGRRLKIQDIDPLSSYLFKATVPNNIFRQLQLTI